MDSKQERVWTRFLHIQSAATARGGGPDRDSPSRETKGYCATFFREKERDVAIIVLNNGTKLNPIYEAQGVLIGRAFDMPAFSAARELSKTMQTESIEASRKNWEKYRAGVEGYVFDQDSLYALDSLAESYYATGDMEEAVRQYQNVQKMKPDHRNATYMLKRIQEELGDEN